MPKDAFIALWADGYSLASAVLDTDEVVDERKGLERVWLQIAIRGQHFRIPLSQVVSRQVAP